MATNPDPVRPATDEAFDIARALLGASHAALAYTDPETKTPGISRIAFGRAVDGGFVTLISSLAPHFAALRASADCAVMLGEPGPKGDPLTHPRLMIRAKAEFVDPAAPDRPALREQWLQDHPKAKLYVDFADFAFVRLHPQSALLNGGFAKAFRFDGTTLV